VERDIDYQVEGFKVTDRPMVISKDLDKESFWVQVHEDELASKDLFSKLKLCIKTCL